MRMEDAGGGWRGCRVSMEGWRMRDQDGGCSCPPEAGAGQHPATPPVQQEPPGDGVQGVGSPLAVGPFRARLAGFVLGRTMTCIKPTRLRSGAPRSPASRPGACGGAGRMHPRIITPPADPILLAGSLPDGLGVESRGQSTALTRPRQAHIAAFHRGLALARH